MVKIVEVGLCFAARNTEVFADGQVRCQVFVLVGLYRHCCVANEDGGVGPCWLFFRLHGVEQLVVVGRQGAKRGMCQTAGKNELTVLNNGSGHFVVVRTLGRFQFHLDAVGQVGNVACNDKAVFCLRERCAGAKCA